MWQEFLLWDSTHVDKGEHSRFKKIWIGPYKIVVVLGRNSYLFKDDDGILLSYPINGVHIKHSGSIQV